MSGVRILYDYKYSGFEIRDSGLEIYLGYAIGGGGIEITNHESGIQNKLTICSLTPNIGHPFLDPDS
jgi:hypothetical protein